MNSILQVQELITKSYQENIRKAFQGEINLGTIISTTESTLLEVGRILVQDMLEVLDEAIRESKARRKEWHIERRQDPKTLNTIFGEVSYQRTYYKHKINKCYSYLSDAQLGIQPHERMDSSLKARLVDHATSMSYQQAVDQVPQSGITSRMSVLNAIRDLGRIPNHAVPPIKRETPEILYIEADEDHVAMQDGPSAIAKIVYVHEGRERIGKERYALKNTRYFTDETGENEELWLSVAHYLENTYDMAKVKKVYLSGDGAAWIRAGVEWIDKSVYVLDKFHLAKSVRTATAHLLYMAAPLWNYIHRGMKQDVQELLRLILQQTDSETKRQAVREARKYILNHWEAIQRQKSEAYVGCSAEGHVSHVLSSRMSSRPMGWSRDGMRHMSSMRVFVQNGGDFQTYIRKIEAIKQKENRVIKLDQRVAKKAQKALTGMIQNISFFNLAQKTGTSVLLKSVRGL